MKETQNCALDSTCMLTFMSMYTCEHHIHTDILIQRSDCYSYPKHGCWLFLACYKWLLQGGSQQYFNCHYDHNATCPALKMFFFVELCCRVSHIYAVSKSSQNSKTKCLHRVIKNTGMKQTTFCAPKFIPLSASLTHPFVWKIVVLHVLIGWYYY